MAVPQRKISKARRDKRRSHHALSPTNWSECSNCGEPKLPHHICAACGYYNGRPVIVAAVADEADAA
ncbi:MAG: 50S ribosomal protein L32 [Geminicoccaceae bacterium]